MDLARLGQTVKTNADEISERVLGRWDEIAGSEPWLELSDELDFDHLPDLVRRLASASLCTEYDREHCLAVARLAADHGAHRAREGFGDTLIFREYHLLRRALGDHLKQEHGESAPVFYATMRLDALSGLASAAALHGLHAVGCPEREAGLHDALRQLLDEWPLPDS